MRNVPWREEEQPEWQHEHQSSSEEEDHERIVLKQEEVSLAEAEAAMELQRLKEEAKETPELAAGPVVSVEAPSAPSPKMRMEKRSRKHLSYR